jgi:hypothetical protein
MTAARDHAKTTSRNSRQRSKVDHEEGLAPKAHTIHSLISQRMSVHDALAELVDNAFAPGKGGADEIWIDVSPHRILVWDHGRGVDDLNRLFQLGNTSSWEDPSDIGLYGVGATNAAIWLGGYLRVTTVRKGQVHTHETDWDDCVKRERWAKPYRGRGKSAQLLSVPPELFVGAQPSSGTLIEIGRRRRGGRNFKMETLMQRLGFTFGPGIRSGKAINIRRHGGAWLQCVPTEPPRLTDEIEFESSVEGMTYRCRAGLMIDPVMHMNAFHLGFSHRVLEKTREPFLDMGCASFYAQVDLGSDWRPCIADHKNAVARYRDELVLDLHKHCSSLIEQGQNFEYELYLADLESLMQAMVDGMLSKAGNVAPIGPPQPTPVESQDEPVLVEPRAESAPNEPSPSDRDKATGGAGSERPGPRSGVIIQFQPKMDVISLCQEEGERLRVLLNRDDPNVAAAMTKPVNSWGLMSQVCAAISSHATALFVRDGVAGLRCVMPKVADRLPVGMETNEVTAEVMTALMGAVSESMSDAA